MKARRVTRLGAEVLGTVTGLLVACCLATPQATGVPERQPQVETSANPAAVEIAPQPCDRTGALTVAMTNTSDTSAFVDARFQSPDTLLMSRQAWSTYLPAAEPDQTVTAPLRIAAARGTRPGTHQVTMEVAGQRLEIPVTVTEAPGNAPADNLALYRQAFASSVHHNVTLCGGVDGNAASADWGDSGTHDATANSFPDYYGVILDRELPVGRVEIHTLDSEKYPASQMGIRDFDIEVRVEGQWMRVAAVRANESGHRSLRFPAVIGDQVRVVVRDSNDHKYSRIVELEVYQS